MYKNGTWDDIKNLREINFSLLSTNKNLTSDIIELHKDKWNYKWLSRNPHITSDFISKNLDKDWDWEFLDERVEIRVEFMPFFRFHTYPSLTYNPHLTWDFVKNNLDKNWDYQKLSRNKKIVKDIESNFVFSNKWNFTLLSENESLSFDHNYEVEFYIMIIDYINILII